MQNNDIKVVIIEPYFDDKPAQSISRRTNAEVAYFAPMVGAFKEVKTYFDLFDYNVNALVTAFRRQGIEPVDAGN